MYENQQIFKISRIIYQCKLGTTPIYRLLINLVLRHDCIEINKRENDVFLIDVKYINVYLIETNHDILHREFSLSLRSKIKAFS